MRLVSLFVVALVAVPAPTTRSSAVFGGDRMQPVIQGDPTIVRRELWAGTGGIHRKWVRAVRDLVEDRFDVDALEWGTPITVWTVDDELIAFDVDGAFATRVDSEGGLRWVFDDGSTLDGPVLARPVRYQSISSRIGLREHPLSRRHRVKFHAGTDYAAPIGTPVYAIADGVAAKVERNWSAGKFVVVKHVDGSESKYLHFDSHAPGLKPGARVGQGEVIGYVGKTGAVTGPHLHFEVRDRNRTPIDPAATTWPAAASVDDDTLRRMHLRRDMLRTLRDDGSRDLLHPLLASSNALSTKRTVDDPERAVLPPVAPVRPTSARSRLTPPPLRRRRPIPTTRPLFDDDPRRSRDALILRSAQLAMDFPEDPRFA